SNLNGILILICRTDRPFWTFMLCVFCYNAIEKRKTANFSSKRKCMADYEPISRRPIAAAFRRTAEAATRLCVRWGIHPDAISYLSIFAALGGAFCFWQSDTAPRLLIIAPVFCYLRLWFNMLDGMVALAAGKATARGEILNDLPDRISDILIFVGVAHSGWMNPILGYWAAIFAFLTALSQAEHCSLCSNGDLRKRSAQCGEPIPRG